MRFLFLILFTVIVCRSAESQDIRPDSAASRTDSLQIPSIPGEMSVTFSADVDEADVKVDGQLIGSLKEKKIHHNLSPGLHFVVFIKEGYLNFYKNYLVSDSTTVLTISMTPIVAPLTIATEPPGASVVINTKQVGVTPLKTFNLPYGENTITLSLPEFRNETRTIFVPNENPIDSSIILRRTPEFLARTEYLDKLSSQSFWIWTGFLVSGAAAGAAGYFHLDVQKKLDLYNSATTDFDTRITAFEEASTLRLAALSVAVASAVVGVFYLFSEPNYNEILDEIKRSESTVQIFPAKDFRGISVAVRF